jgi:ribosomal protein L11 methyltransferase
MTTPAPPHYRLTVTVAPEHQEVVTAWLFSAGAVGVTTDSDTLTTWFEQQMFAPTPLPRPQALAQVTADMFVCEPQVDWQAAFVQTIQPVTVGTFFITPSWLADDLPEDDTLIRLIVDPAQAFGSGHHATTALCLELLSVTADKYAPGRWQVADVGCGSGVLGIAAAKLGGDVEAVDTDPMAVTVTRQNADTNDVTLTTAVGSVSALTRRPDTLIANLLSDTIIALADQLAAAPTKDLIVSGISTQHFPRVRACLEPLVGPAVTVYERDGWIAALYDTQATT